MRFGINENIVQQEEEAATDSIDSTDINNPFIRGIRESARRYGRSELADTVLMDDRYVRDDRIDAFIQGVSAHRLFHDEVQMPHYRPQESVFTFRPQERYYASVPDHAPPHAQASIIRRSIMRMLEEEVERQVREVLDGNLSEITQRPRRGPQF